MSIDVGGDDDYILELFMTWKNKLLFENLIFKTPPHGHSSKWTITNMLILIKIILLDA
jgi:hypothetical protein